MLTPRVMIIDDQAQFRALLAHHLGARWPGAVVFDYDPLAAGRLPDAFSGAGHDLVLLGSPAGGVSGLEWLEAFQRVRGFPPVLFFGEGEEREIVAAIKAGAEDYLTRTRMTHARFVEAAEAALRSRVAEQSPRPEVTRTGPRNYRLVRRLAGTGTSTVWLAHDPATGGEVALKVLAAEGANEGLLDRFLREYSLAAGISHPSIVRIHDLGVADDHAYIAMEYCPGGSLRSRLGQPLDPAAALGLLRTIAGALDALHDAGILHRDLKPANVLLRADDSLALTDFGLARQVALDAALTGLGAIFGTPFYMSPEQGHGEPVDARGDLYSLGVMFHEMLTGVCPYLAETAMGVIIQHRQAPLPQLPATLSALQPVLDRMLAKKPEDRFSSARALLAAISEESGLNALPQ
ncbi:MAG: protein kinase [Chromatiales bacterium]|nr:protein kinase [Chromatiales bacterium]